MLKINSNKYTPKFVDDFYKDGNYYLIKSYVKGINLKTEMKNKNVYFFKNNEFIKNSMIFLKNAIVHMIALTNYLHTKKIILNDYKTNNFLFCPIKNRIFFVDLDNSYIFGNQKIKICNFSFKKIIKKWTDYRIDFHKLGLMFITHFLFNIHYQSFDKKGEKNLKLLKIIWKFYNLPDNFFQVLHDLIYKEKINIKTIKNKLLEVELENYNFVSKKLIDLPEVVELNDFFLKKWKFKEYKNFQISDFAKEDSFHKLFIFFIQGKFSQKNINQLSKLKWILRISNLNEINFEKVEEWYKVIFLNIIFGKYINEKIIDDFISKFMIEINEILVIKNKKEKTFFSPNFRNGTAGLVYLLIILYENNNNNNKYFSLIKKLLSSITFNFSQKISFFDGNAGFGYVFLKAYKVFEEKKYYLESLNKIFMIKFNLVKSKLYSNNLILDNYDFWDGLDGIYFFIKTFLLLK